MTIHRAASSGRVRQQQTGRSADRLRGGQLLKTRPRLTTLTDSSLARPAESVSAIPVPSHSRSDAPSRLTKSRIAMQAKAANHFGLPCPIDIPCSAAANSAPSRYRAAGSCDRHRSISAATLGATAGFRAFTAGRSPARIAATSEGPLSPAKGCWPQAISYITTPALYISLREDASPPDTNSGAAYAIVPTKVRGFVIVPDAPGSSRIAMARPKSITFRFPSSVMMMFSGLMSR